MAADDRVGRGMARCGRHNLKEGSREDARGPAHAAPSADPAPGTLSLSRRKQRGIENWLVLTAVNVATVDHLANIEAVLEEMRERANSEAAPADDAAVR